MGFAMVRTRRAEIFGFDAAHALGDMESMLPDLASDQPALYTPLGLYAPWDQRITSLLNEVRGRARTGVAAPEEIVDVRQPLDALRLSKDAHELALMRRAAARYRPRLTAAARWARRGSDGSSTRSRPS